MARPKSPKCQHCKKAFLPAKSDQKFCSGRCRQAAYRKRHAPKKRRAKPAERAALVATCQHCGGTFWARSPLAKFCSVGCRSMACRTRKAALAEAVAARFSLPDDLAAELIEIDYGRVRQVVESEFRYDQDSRRWVGL